MSEPSSMDSLLGRQISDEQVEKIRDFYVELLGFVPPRIQARTDLLARVDPELLTMQEELRKHCMYPECFDTKTSQLFLFAILLSNLQLSLVTKPITGSRKCQEGTNLLTGFEPAYVP